jgi:hypothetical protein
MEKYIVVDFMAEADPNNQNRIGFCDPVKHPYVNMHPTRFGVYRTGENSQIMCYIPDWHTSPELIATHIAVALTDTVLINEE